MLKLTFFNIRTQVSSWLRKKVLKKVWLRKQFASIQYEDRPEDDHKAQSRKPYWEGSRKSLGDRKGSGYQRYGSKRYPRDKMLFPMEPLKIIGDVISGKSKTSYFKIFNQMNATMLIRKHPEKESQQQESRTKKISTMPNKLEANKMFLILPNYAEKHKAASNNINSCIYNDVEFKVAFTNSKNDKNLLSGQKYKTVKMTVLLGFCIFRGFTCIV